MRVSNAYLVSGGTHDRIEVQHNFDRPEKDNLVGLVAMRGLHGCVCGDTVHLFCRFKCLLPAGYFRM